LRILRFFLEEERGLDPRRIIRISRSRMIDGEALAGHKQECVPLVFNGKGVKSLGCGQECDEAAGLLLPGATG